MPTSAPASCWRANSSPPSFTKEGFDYFVAHSDSAPADAFSLALAGAFESRLDDRTEEAIAKLDAATGLDPGLPREPVSPREPDRNAAQTCTR